MFKNADGKSWGSGKKLNNSINTSYHETCPTLSFDEKYMFFSRYNDVGNKSNIYWVSTDFIKEFKNSTNSVIQDYEQYFQVFPNPAKGIINISFGEHQYKNATVEISNIEGKQIISNNIQNNTTVTFDITGTPNGVYFISLIVDGQKHYKKIILE